MSKVTIFVILWAAMLIVPAIILSIYGPNKSITVMAQRNA